MNELKRRRLEKRYTCEYMSEILGISKAFYWQIENKKRTLSYEMAVKIADIFKTKPDKIFFDEYKNRD